MTKEDIKNYLIDRGASRNLLRMPAVMERIYSYFEVTPESRYSGYMGTIIPMYGMLPRKLSRTLKVGSNGSISIKMDDDERIFEERPNGEAVYINNDNGIMGIDEQGEYLIDEFGMDKGFRGLDGFYIERRTNGTILSNNIVFEDDGSPILIAGYYDRRVIQRNDEEIQDNWEENKTELIETYPQVAQWFEDRETHRKKRQMERINDELVMSFEKDDDTIDIDSDVGDSELAEENKALRSERDELKDKLADREDTIEQLQQRDKENGETIVELKANNRKKDEEISMLQQENAEKEERIDDLQTRNSNLQERNTKLQAMLSKALEKLQQIKSSIFGRFFFTKEERLEAKKAKKLPAGKEERE